MKHNTEKHVKPTVEQLEVREVLSSATLSPVYDAMPTGGGETTDTAEIALIIEDAVTIRPQIHVEFDSSKYDDKTVFKIRYSTPFNITYFHVTYENGDGSREERTHTVRHEGGTADCTWSFSINRRTNARGGALKISVWDGAEKKNRIGEVMGHFNQDANRASIHQQEPWQDQSPTVQLPRAEINDSQVSQGQSIVEQNLTLLRNEIASVNTSVPAGLIAEITPDHNNVTLGAGTTVVNNSNSRRAFMASGTGGAAMDASDFPVGAQPRTLSAWVKVDKRPQGKEISIAAYGKPGIAGAAFMIGGTSDGQAFVSQWGDSVVGGNLSIGQWHNVTATYADGFAALFLDGVSVGTKQMHVDTVANTNLQIGYVDPKRILHGRVADLAIFNRALNHDEIVAYIKNIEHRYQLYENIANLEAEIATTLSQQLTLVTTPPGGSTTLLDDTALLEQERALLAQELVTLQQRIAQEGGDAQTWESMFQGDDATLFGGRHRVDRNTTLLSAEALDLTQGPVRLHAEVVIKNRRDSVRIEFVSPDSQERYAGIVTTTTYKQTTVFGSSLKEDAFKAWSVRQGQRLSIDALFENGMMTVTFTKKNGASFSLSAEIANDIIGHLLIGGKTNVIVSSLVVERAVGSTLVIQENTLKERIAHLSMQLDAQTQAHLSQVDTVFAEEGQAQQVTQAEKVTPEASPQFSYMSVGGSNLLRKQYIETISVKLAGLLASVHSVAKAQTPHFFSPTNLSQEEGESDHHFGQRQIAADVAYLHTKHDGKDLDYMIREMYYYLNVTNGERNNAKEFIGIVGETALDELLKVRTGAKSSIDMGRIEAVWKDTGQMGRHWSYPIPTPNEIVRFIEEEFDAFYAWLARMNHEQEDVRRAVDDASIRGVIGKPFAEPESSVSSFSDQDLPSDANNNGEAKIVTPNGDILSPMTQATLSRIRDNARVAMESAHARNDTATEVHFQKQLEAAEGLLRLIPAGSNVPIIGGDRQAMDWSDYIQETTTDPIEWKRVTDVADFLSSLGDSVATLASSQSLTNWDELMPDLADRLTITAKAHKLAQGTKIAEYLSMMIDLGLTFASAQQAEIKGDFVFYTNVFARKLISFAVGWSSGKISTIGLESALIWTPWPDDFLAPLVGFFVGLRAADHAEYVYETHLSPIVREIAGEYWDVRFSE